MSASAGTAGDVSEEGGGDCAVTVTPAVMDREVAIDAESGGAHATKTAVVLTCLALEGGAPDSPSCNEVNGPYSAPERPDMLGAERVLPGATISAAQLEGGGVRRQRGADSKAGVREGARREEGAGPVEPSCDADADPVPGVSSRR